MNESTVAVVPIRSLRDGKTRLSAVLDLEARQTLIRCAAAGVIEAASASDVLKAVVVVSSDAETLDWASSLGPNVVALPQPDRWPGLNGAIEAGREWTLAHDGQRLLSLFADLPLLTPDDVRGIAAQPEAVVLGADRRHEGTNALLLRLTDGGTGFHFAFGEGSLAKHRQEAHRLGLDSAVYDAAGIGFDLDTPDDWDELLAQRDGLPATHLPFRRRQAPNDHHGNENGTGVEQLDSILAKCGASVG